MNLTIEKWKDKNLHLETNNERHTMNNNSSKEADLPLILKEEGNSTTDNEKAKASASSSSLASSQWTRLKDPRIVRVSRAFGGKDRHSKVCTIRGLRDRRVRLSVPTAIQLYDLQNRLGLNQPSKVVDWLLNAAKHEIDELPPLPNFPTPGNFPFNSTYPSSLITSNESNTSQQLNQHLLNINRSIHELDGSSSSQNSIWKLKPKEVSRENIVTDNEGATASAHVFPNNNNLLQRENHPSFLSLLNTMPVSSNYQWEASGDVNTQLGNHGFVMNNVIRPLPSTLSLSTGNSQMLGATTQSYFSSHVAAMEMDHQRQIINHHYQMLSSSSQNPLTNSLNNSFSLAMMTTPPKFFHSTNSRESPSNKDQDFTLK